MTTFHRLAATGAALFVIAGSALAAAPANAVDATFPPTAVNDQYVAGQDNDLVVGPEIGLLVNDSAGGNADLAVNFVGLSPDGVINYNLDGSFRYIPTPGFSGVATFTYNVTAGNMTSNDATITFTVLPTPPHKLLGTPDFYTTPMDTPFSTTGGVDDVILNDTDPVYVGGIDDVTGEVTVNIYGQMTYTPAPGFVGTKTFSYYLSDGKNIDSDWILVTIDVTAPAITIIPSNPIVPGNPGNPGGTQGGDLPTLAYTGVDDVTTWLIAPAVALVVAGAFAVWFARRRAALR